MPQPYNYMTQGLKDPAENLLQTVALARNMRGLRESRAQETAQAEMQRQFQADIRALGTSPSPAGLAQMIIKYPSMSAQFKQAQEILGEEQRAANVNQASQIYAALSAGQPEIAQRMLQEQALANRNTGRDREAKTLEDLSELVRVSPQTAQTSAGLFLASAMGPEAFTEAFTKLQSERREAELQPAALSEAQSKARKAAVAAGFAEAREVLELQKRGWDIYKVQEDAKIARENVKIASLKAQIAKADSEQKKEAFRAKLSQQEDARAEKLRGVVADVESANMNIDNMLNTADRILKTPVSVVGAAAGPISSRIPTLSQETADFESLIENFDAQAFLAQVPNLKGMGALSDAEGKKITAALQNFSLRQSPERLLENVREAQRLLLKARANVARRYGVPQTIPDTPAAEVSPEEVETLIRRYGGP